MPPDLFWTSPDCHVAVNPHSPAEAHGLLAWASHQRRSGECYFQTSGSEGLPKWVALSKQAFLISAREVNAHFHVTASDRWLIALPLHHVGGFAIQARAYLSGSEVIQGPTRWQPSHFAAVCRDNQITLASLVPTQIHDLVRDGIVCPESLRVVIVGGGGMVPELAQAARLLGWPVYQSYGMTEAASQVATQSYPQHGDSPIHGRLQVLPHWQTAQDTQGRLLLRGPALASGYVQRAESGDWIWQEIGAEWQTRDVVHLEQSQGHTWLTFIGRESGYVKILGELIHLAPLQARLEALALELGLAAMPCLMAIPDPRMESKLILVIDSVAAASLVPRFNAITAPLCHLQDVVQVAEIPRTALGKVDVTALRRLLGMA